MLLLLPPYGGFFLRLCPCIFVVISEIYRPILYFFSFTSIFLQLKAGRCALTLGDGFIFFISPGNCLCIRRLLRRPASGGFPVKRKIFQMNMLTLLRKRELGYFIEKNNICGEFIGYMHIRHRIEHILINVEL